MQTHPTVLIVGGHIGHHTLRRLQARLSSFVFKWIPTRESDPDCSSFRARLRRPETCLVVILNGLIRHQHGHDLVRLSRQYAKRVLHQHRSPSITQIQAALEMCGATKTNFN